MSRSVRYAWDEALRGYDFGAHHPMAPIRVELTVLLSQLFGLFDLPSVQVASPPPADHLLGLVHTPEYVAAVRRCAQNPRRYEPQFGLGTDDNPCFPAMHDVTSRVVGGTVDVARAVWRGEAEHGVNVTGGLHHGMAGHASGFCIYNDIAVALKVLLAEGAERIAYVDVDVHHGDGVQALFWNDPRVLTISLHESPRTLFPGTGYPHETGGADAEGSAVNVALPPGTNDAGWLRAFHSIVPPLLAEFRPQILVSQHGADTHVEDPLAHLALTVDGQRAAALALHDLAHERCGGRWVAVGGGGYAVTDVVPRTWTHLLAVSAGVPIDPVTPVPPEWRSFVAEATGRVAPLRMTDGRPASYVSWETGYDPGDWLDQAVIATRKAVFPLYGLDPHW
jgi:acetoin utilization protein AcuC